MVGSRSWRTGRARPTPSSQHSRKPDCSETVKKAALYLLEFMADDTSALDSVLGFYAIQLQSHAALILASFVGVLAVLQVWIVARPLSPTFLVVLPLSLSILVTAAVYGLMRLIVYGKLSQSILGGSAKEFSTLCETCPTYFPHAQISSYGSQYFENLNKNSWWYRLYGKRQQPRVSNQHPRKIVLAVVSVGGLILSYMLLR